jgi:6-phosphogluconate dehydrogenase
MDIAMIGLGKMGSNMVSRLLRGGHRVVAFDAAKAD